LVSSVCDINTRWWWWWRGWRIQIILHEEADRSIVVNEALPMFLMDMSFDGETFEPGDFDLASCNVAQRCFVAAKPLS